MDEKFIYANAAVDKQMSCIANDLAQSYPKLTLVR